MPATIATKANKNSMPTYCRRKGYKDAIVTLTDAVTAKRKDYWLGEYGSTASHEMYHRVLAEWESRGRRLPPSLKPSSNGQTENAGATVNVLALTEPSIAKAAFKVNISEKTLRRWMNDPKFAAEYRKARREVFGQAIALVQRYAAMAVNTFAKVMADASVAPQAKVAAAAAVLRFGRQGIELGVNEKRPGKTVDRTRFFAALHLFLAVFVVPKTARTPLALQNRGLLPDSGTSRSKTRTSGDKPGHLAPASIRHALPSKRYCKDAGDFGIETWRATHNVTVIVESRSDTASEVELQRAAALGLISNHKKE